MKVVFSLPCLDGTIKTECALSLFAAQRLLHEAGIAYEVDIISGCPYLPTARNTLAAMFLADKDATDLFFIDSDVAFDASAVANIRKRPEDIVAGIYPLQRDWPVGYPVEAKTVDGIPIGRDGLVEANFLPTGFMRIKRRVFERMIEAYPHLEYADSVVEVLGSKVEKAWDFFHMGIDQNKQRWTTEDYAFCQRWRDIGGQLWVYPDIDFRHVGMKAYRGNYHEYLMRLPGGAKDPLKEAA
jgi:hypothetical protein